MDASAACTVDANNLEVPSTITLSGTFTLPFYAAAPPFGRRLICCVLEFGGAHISVVFTGNTYPFRDALNAAGIGGDYGPPDDDGRREYYRVLPSQAMEEFGLAATLSSLFKGSIVLCILRADPPADSPGAEYVQKLKAQSNLAFLTSAP